MSPPDAHPGIAARILRALIRFYQFTFSSVMGRQCRFYPTCSVYTREAILRYGAGRGLWLGVCRIGRCHPWNPGGHDPVPDNWQKLSCCDKTADISKKKDLT